MDPRRPNHSNNSYNRPSDRDPQDPMNPMDGNSAFNPLNYPAGYQQAPGFNAYGSNAGGSQYAPYPPNMGMGMQQGSNTYYAQHHGTASPTPQPLAGHSHYAAEYPGSIQYGGQFSNIPVGGQPLTTTNTAGTSAAYQTSPLGVLQPSGTPGTSSRADQRHPLAGSGGQRAEGTSSGPFQCPLCSQTFDRQARLQGHIHLHNGDRPYVCDGSCGVDGCQSGFPSPEALSSHKSNKARVKCEKCNNLVTKKNMSRHLKEHCSSLY